MVSVEKTLAGRLERLTKANDDTEEKLKAVSKITVYRNAMNMYVMIMHDLITLCKKRLSQEVT